MNHVQCFRHVDFVSTFQVCQKSTDGWYNCGSYQQPIWLLNNRDPLQYTIEYPFGDGWRWNNTSILGRACTAMCSFKFESEFVKSLHQDFMLLLFFLGSRVSIFSFREVPDQQPTTVKYLGEYNLQYVSASKSIALVFSSLLNSLQNFIVEGSCIGQRSCV